MHPSGTPIWSFMFITVACGAISGFHSTQSPLMARCMKNEKQGHFVFYGAMVAEGIDVYKRQPEYRRYPEGHHRYLLRFLLAVCSNVPQPGHPVRTEMCIRDRYGAVL